MDKKIRIGVLGTSDIAYRRFIPAILNSNRFEYAGVAHVNAYEWKENFKVDDTTMAVKHEKAVKFSDAFGSKVYESYADMLSDREIDAVYIPLPPGLHYRWGETALTAGKHVLLEKPFTTSVSDTEDLMAFARKKKLAAHENFAFIFHKQIDKICDLLDKNEIGEIRLIKSAFGFPYRGSTDFRYFKTLGGGALLDCGVYPLKLASLLLGDSTQVVCSQLSSARGHDVDVFGSATLKNDKGLVAQISFGMDNAYRCELEVWGSEGFLIAPRVFTPTSDMETNIIIRKNEEIVLKVGADDQFKHSAERFADCIENENLRKENYDIIFRQSILVDMVRKGEERDEKNN